MSNHLLFGACALAAMGAGTTVALAQPGSDRGPRGAVAMFTQMDADRDGRVTWEEAWAYVQRRFTEADRDGSGGLTAQEFQDAIRAGLAARRPAAAQGGDAAPGTHRGPTGDFAERADAMFRVLDADRDGRLSLNELRPMVEARFRALDANLNNAIEQAELPQRRGRPGGQGPGAPVPAPQGGPASPG
jgi:hypothetical protein